MLKTEEIVEIENRWKKYKLNSATKISVASGVALLIIAGVLFFIPNNKDTDIATSNISDLVDNKSIATAPNIVVLEDNLILDNHTIIATKQPTDSPKLSSDVVKVEKKEVTEAVKTPPITKTSQTKVAKVEPKKEEQKKENNIIIETASVKNIQTLIDRFNSTKNIVFANMVAEEYFEKNDYNNSLKWALVANELDSKNEKSWVMFAKAKTKLGYEDEAVHALEVYTKHAPKSNDAITLLSNIKSGNFK